jgi:adenylate cyclase
MSSPRLSALLTRKVSHVVGAYLAGSWALLEFASWASDHGLAPARVPDLVLLLLLLLLPLVATVAWRAGERGPAAEMVTGPSSPVAAIPSRPVAPTTSQVAPTGSPANSVAILPLEELAPGSEDRYLGAAISDEIITALARVEGLRVASRTSSFALGAEAHDPREIGRRLGVGAVLEGSVQRAGDRLRVSTRLASATDGFELWSHRWDATMTDLFRIEDEITSGVVGALRVLLTEGAERALAMPRTHIRAYEHYLKGRQYLYQSRRKAFGYARQLFEQAIEVDPDYALAHAALADATSMERILYPAAEVDLERAERASLRALQLAPGLAEAHCARALVLWMQRRYAEAEAEFSRALAIDPRLFEGHYFLARIHFQQGRTEAAASSFAAAARLRDDHEAAFFAGQAHEALGQTETAAAFYGRAANYSESHMRLNPDDARAATIRAVACYRTGRVREGLEWAAKAVEMEPTDGGVLYNVACLYSVAGELEQAIGYLERAAATGFGARAWMENDPDLKPILGDSRVEAILGAM